jgi:hypothetical protein
LAHKGAARYAGGFFQKGTAGNCIHNFLNIILIVKWGSFQWRADSTLGIDKRSEKNAFNILTRTYPSVAGGRGFIRAELSDG